jgi:hypothetical protein
VSEPGVQGLPPDIAELLAHERQPPPAPDVAKARVAARLGLGPPVGPGVIPAKALAGAKIAVLVLAVAGGAAWWLGRPVPATVVSPPPPPAAPATVPPPTPSPAVAPPRPVAARPAPVETEIALLLRARRALAAGDAARALAVLERHRRRWPAGELLQEREVLTIQALAAAGSRAEARQRADAFLARFPSSTLAVTVRQLRQNVE